MQQKKNVISQTSSPFSTGAGGVHFEERVQAVFLLSLITSSFSPVLDLPLISLTFQAKHKGWHTDDVIAESKNAKLLCQIKHRIRLNQSDKEFCSTIQAAWVDFHNENFNKKTDRICLVTQDIPNEYAAALFRIHEYAIGSANAADFFIKATQVRFSNKNIRKSLDLIRNIIGDIDKSTFVTENELWEFFKVFCILVFDLDYEYSINKILSKALLVSFTDKTSPDLVWSKLCERASQYNQSACTITTETIPDEIAIFFIGYQKFNENIELLSDFEPSEQLAILAVIGSWNENNKHDRDLVSTLIQKEYTEIKNSIFNNHLLNSKILSCENGIWKVNNRKIIIEQSRIFLDDVSVSRLFTATGKMLVEKSEHEDYSGTNRVKKYSDSLQYNSETQINSIIEGICIFCNLKNKPKHWSANLLENNAYQFVRDIFTNSNWTRWASLAEYLRMVAEICPREYLHQLEHFLVHAPDDAMTLVSYKRGYFSQGFTAEIIWSLEVLAWSEKYFISAIQCLGELAEIKGISNKGNNPVDSIISILLPWKPQTTASQDKKINALEALQKSSPEIAWTVITKLLPGATNSTFGTVKPQYYMNDIQDETFDSAQIKERYEEFIKLAIKWAANNIGKIISLIRNSDYLSEEQRLSLLQELEIKMDELNGDEKYHIWVVLQGLYSRKTKRRSEVQQKIKHLISKAKPEDIRIQYRYYFEDDSRFERISYQNYITRQKKAIKAIYLKYGPIEVLDFAKQLNNINVSFMLGNIITRKDLGVLIAAFSENENKNFIKNTLSSYLNKHKVSSLPHEAIKQYHSEEIADLLSLIPISAEAIGYISKLLKHDERFFWEKTHGSCNQCFAEELTVKLLASKLMLFGRNRFFIYQLEIWKEYINTFTQDELFQMLENSATETTDSFDDHAIHTILAYIQQLDDVDKERLAKVECMYITTFSSSGGANPRGLTYILNNYPMEFCNFIEILYKKRHEIKNPQRIRQYSESVVIQAQYILFTVHVVPGTDWNGAFHEEICRQWIEEAEKWAKENDRYEVTMINVGEGLSYAEKNEKGLPNDVILDILNTAKYEDMRNGYRTGLYNQRGVHWVDHEGKAELDLSEKYSQQAEYLEKEGYARVAEIYNNLAIDYQHEAERVRDKKS